MILFDLLSPVNDVIMVLYGLQLTTGATYAIVLTGTDSLQPAAILNVTDVSSSPDRYQRFSIASSGITLALGDYQYSAYELSGSTILYTNVLEKGRWTIIGQVSQPAPPSYENPTTGEFPSYQNPYYSKT